MPDQKSSKGFTIRRRDALIGGAFALASGIAYARMPEITSPVVDIEDFEGWVPSQVGPWQGEGSSEVVLPPPDTLRDRLYDNLVTRGYRSPDNPPIMMLLAYNNVQDGVLQVHRPEICYSAGGYQLTDTQTTNLALGPQDVPASGFTANIPSRTEEILYFTRLGTAFPTSWAEQKLAVIRANIEGDIPDGMMMRLSTIGVNTQTAREQMNRFATEFFNSAPAPLRRLLVGDK